MEIRTSTTTKYGVAPGQQVGILLDLKQDQDTPRLLAKRIRPSSVEFIDHNKIIYTAPLGNWNGDGFTIELSNGDQSRFSILIDEEFERTESEQHNLFRSENNNQVDLDQAYVRGLRAAHEAIEKLLK